MQGCLASLYPVNIRNRDWVTVIELGLGVNVCGSPPATSRGQTWADSLQSQRPAKSVNCFYSRRVRAIISKQKLKKVKYAGGFRVCFSALFDAHQVMVSSSSFSWPLGHSFVGWIYHFSKVSHLVDRGSLTLFWLGNPSRLKLCVPRVLTADNSEDNFIFIKPAILN